MLLTNCIRSCMPSHRIHIVGNSSRQPRVRQGHSSRMFLADNVMAENNITSPSETTPPDRLCYGFTDPKSQQNKQLCILDLNITAGYHMCMQAWLNGAPCTTCTTSSCLDTTSEKFDFLFAFDIDCANIDRSYANIKICGDSVDPFSHPDGYNTLRGSSISNNNNNNNNSDDGDLMLGFVAYIVIFGFIGFRCRRACQTSASSTSNQRYGRLPQEAVEMTARAVPVVQGRVVDAGTARTVDCSSNILPVKANGEFVCSLYDAAMEDSSVSKVREQTTNCQWQILQDFLQIIKENAGARGYYHKIILCQIEKKWDTCPQEFSPLLKAWVQAEPNNNDCRILRANAYLRWAWHVRTSSLAADVPKEAWPVFYQRLEMAKAELDAAREMNPNDALIIAPSLTYERARRKDTRREELTSSRARINSLLEQLESSDNPLNFDAYSAALQFKCEKWGGSHKEMFDFVLQTVSKLPEGHPLWCLVVQAHRERHEMMLIDFRMMRSRMTREQTRHAFAFIHIYWERPEVKGEIMKAYQHCLGSSQMSVDLPHEKYILLQVRNWFTYGLAKIGNKDLARRECLAIGSRPMERPWLYKGDPLLAYYHHCSSLGVNLEGLGDSGQVVD